MKTLIINGNIGANAVVRTSEKGDTYITFSVAIKHGTKTDWINVSAGEKFIKLVPHLTKGTKLAIIGTPLATAYIDKDNKAVAQIKCYATTIELISSQDNKEIQAPIIEDSEDSLPPF